MIASILPGPTDGLHWRGGLVQQLHLVGFTTDHKGLILGARRGSKEGGYVVMLDQALVEQIEELLRLQAGESPGSDGARGAGVNGRGPLLRRPKAESRLTPREVQAFLRAGQTVSEIAEAAGMSEDWVGRFAPPVLAEQAQVVERATRFSYSRPRVGPSTQPLAESVLWNLAERGVILSGADAEEAWSAYQQPDGGWVVRVSYVMERRRQHADWAVDVAQGRVRALNRLASELGYVEQGRRRPPALPPANPPTASAAQRSAPTPEKPAPPVPVSPPTTPFAANANPLSKGRIADSNTPRPSSPRRPLPRREPLPEGPMPEERGTPPPSEPLAPRRTRPLTSAKEGDPKSDRLIAGSSAARSSGAAVPETPGAGEPRPARQRDPDAPRRQRPLQAPSRMGAATSGTGTPGTGTPGTGTPGTGTGASAPSSTPANISRSPVARRPLRSGGPVTRVDTAASGSDDRDQRSDAAPSEAATPAPATADEGTGSRFGRVRPAAQRKASTAERFGVGRTAPSRTNPSAITSTPEIAAPRAQPRVAAPRAERSPAEDEWQPPVEESPAPPLSRPSGRLPRPLRAQPVAGAQRQPGDPVTAPVPVIVIGDYGTGPVGEDVSIATTQAGFMDEDLDAEAWTGPSTQAHAVPEDRQPKSGRMRLRRGRPGAR